MDSDGRFIDLYEQVTSPPDGWRTDKTLPAKWDECMPPPEQADAARPLPHRYHPYFHPSLDVRGLMPWFDMLPTPRTMPRFSDVDWVAFNEAGDRRRLVYFLRFGGRPLPALTGNGRGGSSPPWSRT